MAAHVQINGMQLDLGDKAFAVASDAGLLRRLKNQFDELGGSAVHLVRKLGVDYALSTMVGKSRLSEERGLGADFGGTSGLNNSGACESSRRW